VVTERDREEYELSREAEEQRNISTGMRKVSRIRSLMRACV